MFIFFVQFLFCLILNYNFQYCVLKLCAIILIIVCSQFFEELRDSTIIIIIILAIHDWYTVGPLNKG